MSRSKRTRKRGLHALVMHAGLPAPAAAERAIVATLTALGELLDDGERHLLSSVLPSELAALLQLKPFDRHADPTKLVERVAASEPTLTSAAREHVQIVCGALATMLDPASQARLQKALPPDLVALFQTSETPEQPPHADRYEPQHHVLATGRPGSAHPVSSSRPPEPAHSVGERNPHGDTKLSSTHGFTQEATEESLATERPRDDRTISRRTS